MNCTMVTHNGQIIHRSKGCGFNNNFHSVPSSDSASEARLYSGSDDEATDPKMCLGSAAQENTQTQSDPARFFLLISSAIHRATHVPVLQCLTAIVINS